MVFNNNNKKIISILPVIYKRITIKGKNQPRRAKSGKQLPNARKIRTTLFPSVDNPSPKYNTLFMQFGQTVAHDTELILSKVLSKFLKILTYI